MTTEEKRKFTEEEKEDIQAYITSGFSHLDYAAYLFLKITDGAKAKTWLQNLLDANAVTSAGTWPKDEQGKKIKTETTFNIAFTQAGLAKMGLSDEALCTFSKEFREGIAPTDGNRSTILGDKGNSAPVNWEIGGSNNEELHIFLALYGRDKPTLDKHLESHTKQIKDSGGFGSPTIENANRLKDNREHFGFHDGIGQPKILGVVHERFNDDPNVVPTGEFVLGYKNAYGLYPTSPLVPNVQDLKNILPPDPNPYHQNTYKDFGHNGSYVVYRKLNQDVAAFWSFMEENADILPNDKRGKGWAMLWLASKCVGRWPSGVSLVDAPAEDDPNIKEDAEKNDFLYMEKDEYGLSCPFGSHIRRSNPRDSLMPKNVENSTLTMYRHRIMRRGLTYGTPLFNHDILLDVEHPEKLKALLDLESYEGKDEPRGFQFIPIMANIQRQFEFIQQSWSNNPAFNGLNQSKDPLIGSNPDAGTSPDSDKESYMSIPNKPNMLRTSGLTRFVTVRGGAYLFMPSLTSLRYLAQAK